MNDYRLHIRTSDGNAFERLVTERNESAAKKAAKTLYQGEKIEVLEVELIREGTCATKQQERETLEVIKKMVEELGPQSYLATAFEGCFEDAEQNIEDDAAYSMKGRFEKAMRDAGYFKKAAEHFSAEAEKAREEAKKLQEKIEVMEQGQMEVEDFNHFVSLVEKEIKQAEVARDEAAAVIVEYAEQPESVEFRQAVQRNRSAVIAIKLGKERLERLNKLAEMRGF